MIYVYAAMLLHKAGKEVTEDSVKKVLSGAGVEVDDARVKALLASLEGVNIDEAIEKSAQVATAAPAASSDAPAEGGEGDKKKDDAKAKEEDKKSEEQAAAGLGALFG